MISSGLAAAEARTQLSPFNLRQLSAISLLPVIHFLNWPESVDYAIVVIT